MRRQPQQARGQRRVNKILDAASDVFSEIGYEAATTNLIAIRANTSIGSLYQFFPNKEAILSALAHRYTHQLGHLLHTHLDHGMFPLPTFLERMVDGLAEYYRVTPAFQPMFRATPSSPAMNSAAESVCRQIVERLAEKLSTENGELSLDKGTFYAEITVFIMRALIPLEHDAEGQKSVVPEIKRMVTAYLRSTGHFELPLE